MIDGVETVEEVGGCEGALKSGRDKGWLVEEGEVRDGVVGRLNAWRSKVANTIISNKSR